MVSQIDIEKASSQNRAAATRLLEKLLGISEYETNGQCKEFVDLVVGAAILDITSVMTQGIGKNQPSEIPNETP